MTCEEQDYLRSQRISLVEAELAASHAIEMTHSFRGINSLDFSLRNTGSEDAQFALAVDLCMSCQFDEDCPSTALCRRTGLCQDGVNSCSEATSCGLDPDVLESDDLCDIPERGACLLDGYSTPCVEVRELTDIIPAGDQTRDRLSESDLGVGDEMHVELICFAQCIDDEQCDSSGVCNRDAGSCSDGDAFSCSAELDFVVTLRQPECRDDGDCESDEICDFRFGICKGEESGDSGCATVSSRPEFPLVILLVFGAMWAGRRRFSA